MHSFHNYRYTSVFDYVDIKKYKKYPSDIDSLFFLSFEDAFFSFLEAKNISKGSTILFPDFYCIPVVQNIIDRGYTCEFYPLDKNFQANAKTFIHAIKQHNPSIVVFFHVGGITSNLKVDQSWIKEVSSQTYIIEDCVHRILDPQNLNFINEHHFYIDSIRKMTPLHGSTIFGKKGTLTTLKAAPIIKYKIKSVIFYILSRIFSGFEKFLPVSKFTDTFISKHENIIGYTDTPTKGFFIYNFLFKCIDHIKIHRLKEHFALLYKKYLYEIFNNSTFFEIEILRGDYKYLRGYPIGINSKNNEILLQKLKENNIHVWSYFPESPWSKDKEVIFLPMLFSTTEKEIKKIAEILKTHS